MNKYRNKKVQVDMYVFDSIAESKRYKSSRFKTIFSKWI